MSISNNVMKMDEGKGKSVVYRIGCACMGDDCDCTIGFDKDFGDIEVNFYQNINGADYWNNNWFFTRGGARIKTALKVLWTGELQLEGGFIVQGEEHIDSIIEAGQEGKRKMILWGKENEEVDLQ